MLRALSRALDRFRGGGEAAVTIPSMDGALRPNVRIENAPVVHKVAAPDNLVLHRGAVLFSSGESLMQLNPGGEPISRERLPSEITCLASHASGAIAIGQADGGVLIRGGAHDGAVISMVGDRSIVAATAACFDGPDGLLLCLGSQRFPAAKWKHDLMSNGASGSVWRIDLATLRAECLGDGLAWPFGIALRASGSVTVSESWAHRIVELAPNRQPRTLYGDLPGYPARIAATPDNDELWLAVFAPRMQLIEFVLREDEYRTRMIAGLDPEYWIAPSLHAARSFLEPLQGGSLKQLGELKPWAPTRSYGLVVRLDREAQPLESMHSRANGTRHGVTSCLPIDGGVLAASKGGDVIVAIER